MIVNSDQIPALHLRPPTPPPPPPAHRGVLAPASSPLRFVDVCWNQNHVHGGRPPRRAHPCFQRWMVTAQRGLQPAGVDRADTSFRRGFPPSLPFHSSFFHPSSIFTSATFRRSCLALVSVRSDGLAVVFAHICIPVLLWSELQGETKILKLKNLRPQDYANYSCIASVRNVCGIPDRSVIFTLTNRTGTVSGRRRRGQAAQRQLTPPLSLSLLSLPVHQAAGGGPHRGQPQSDGVAGVHHHGRRAPAPAHLGQQQRQPAAEERGEWRHAHAARHHVGGGGRLQLCGEQQRGESSQEVDHHCGAR